MCLRGREGVDGGRDCEDRQRDGDRANGLYGHKVCVSGLTKN